MKNQSSIYNLNSIKTNMPSAVHMLTIKELAQKTGISEHLIRKLCKTNQIKHIKSGVKYLINYERFIDYLNN